MVVGGSEERNIRRDVINPKKSARASRCLLLGSFFYRLIDFFFV